MLEQFHGFFWPVEARLRAVEGWGEHGVDIAARCRAALLEADLRTLGVETTESLPACWELPDLADLASGFGCLYVLEGSTLGGQYISRHIRTTLGVTPETGGRFFHGYGERTGAMWRQFGEAVTAYAVEPETKDRVVAAAVATFRRIFAVGWDEETPRNRNRMPSAAVGRPAFRNRPRRSGPGRPLRRPPCDHRRRLSEAPPR